jgi:hypothetical protein
MLFKLQLCIGSVNNMVDRMNFVHFLDLPDYFFIELLDYLFENRYEYHSKTLDPIMSLLYCFNYKLKYKLLYLTPKINIENNNKFFVKQMLKLRGATFNIVPDFFLDTLTHIVLNKNEYGIHETRKPFNSLPPNLTYLRTTYLHASEFAILPKGLTHLEISSLEESPDHAKPITFNLPNLLKLIIRNENYDFNDEYDCKMLECITKCLPENLEELSIENFSSLIFNLPTPLPKLKKFKLYDCKFRYRFDLKILPQTLVSIEINYNHILGYHFNNLQDQVLSHVEYFYTLQCFITRIPYEKLGTNILIRLPERLIKFGYIDQYLTSDNYNEFIFIRCKDKWIYEAFL